VTHLCPRGKFQSDLDKVSRAFLLLIQLFSTVNPQDTDPLLRKRKAEDDDAQDEEDIKMKCPCPICGEMFLEEAINNHLDTCLNRSAVLELVRETDKQIGKEIKIPPRKKGYFER
jgi:hypothetical protein